METLLFAHSVGVIGGAERVTLSIIKGVKDHYHCALACPSTDSDLSTQATMTGAKALETSFNQPQFSQPLQTLLQLIKHYRLLAKLKPKLVHCGDLLALRSLQPACKLLNIPMICHVHFPYEKGFMEWALKNRYAPATFIFCSQELHDNLAPDIQRLSPGCQLTVIHNGVDTDFFTPQAAPNNAIPHIGIIANLQERKGHDDFLQMARILTDQRVDAHYDIIGGDILQAPREPYLKQRATELGIAERVTFHGQISDVRQALSTLDIVVCASHEEAFPISILEAMACGKAIVSTNVNGIPEALDDNINALLVQKQDSKALASAVEMLIRKPDLKKRLEISARETACDQFSILSYKKKAMRLFNSIN